jgi:nucleoside-diphosphate-sugar epimerase
MKQSILVLGANGFIGRHVVAALAATGWAAPIAGVRRASAVQGGREQRTVDATNVESIRAAMQGVTAVINCVAGDADTLVSSAKALVAAASSTTQVRLMHLSTMSVYGSAEGLLSESSPLRADLGPYSEAKLAAEESLKTHPRAVMFRPGCVFGPDSEQWTVRMARLLLARRLGDLGPAGDGYCNLVHVDDVALAIIRALETPACDGHVFNLSTPNPPTWNEFLTGFAIALRAVPVRRISSRQLRLETKLLAPPFKIAEILGRKLKLDASRLPPPIPSSLLRLMSQEIRLDTQSVEKQLGVRWKPLSASLEESARWYLGLHGGAAAMSSGPAS